MADLNNHSDTSGLLPNQVGAPMELYCDIVRVTPGYESPNYDYVIEDTDGVVVARGTSSSPDWVRHDAGGYHTGRNFNDKYGVGGWHVNFRF